MIHDNVMHMSEVEPEHVGSGAGRAKGKGIE